VKTLLIAEHSEDLPLTNDLKNIFGNTHDECAQMLSIQNNQGMTPLILAVFVGDLTIFNMILSLTIHLDKN
jgi:hypothetical protein